MKRLTPKLFQTLTAKVTKAGSLPDRALQIWMDGSYNAIPNPNMQRHFSMECLKKHTAFVEQTYVEFKDGQPEQANANMQEIISACTDLECALKKIKSRFRTFDTEEKKIISSAVSELAHVLYKISLTAKDMPYIQGLIAQALVLNPQNEQAKQYQLDFDLNKLHP